MDQISTQEHPRKTVHALDKRMTYVEMGSGHPIIFQHGNPTSSYLWRNIMPKLAPYGRCIAVDLIGMGDSDKLSPSGPNTYTFAQHKEYLDAAWYALGVHEQVTLVVHDWGSALGFHWAHRHPDAVRGIAFMEALVRPGSWDSWPEAAREIFQAFRSPAGEKMVLEDNVFVEQVLPGAVLRDLSEAEMTVYRRPFQQPGEDRRPTLTWPRQIPIDGTPEDVVSIVAKYADWLSKTPIPKLFINADPGAILTGEQREFCRSWPNLTEVTVKGSHFIQEDSPAEVADALIGWIQTI